MPRIRHVIALTENHRWWAQAAIAGYRAYKDRNLLLHAVAVWNHVSNLLAALVLSLSEILLTPSNLALSRATKLHLARIHTRVSGWQDNVEAVSVYIIAARKD